jgi:hypothetical protein
MVQPLGTRPPFTPEEAGDTLAFDLMATEQDPMLSEFDKLPIAKRWTALPGEPLPPPRDEFSEEVEPDMTRGHLVEQ